MTALPTARSEHGTQRAISRPRFIPKAQVNS